ncbi:hypothetical protein MuYL_3558 [Mucilaginibacter xinganensis]|uniref:Uncharacterized protein n=1 Tax=Mucilaginibacter xinganensis TaxID=1234841 RepID=A0A223P002_9SPHI|nr:hypothetical protein MuYL_3558 [Mucilaginibacter xinganensis]
MHRAKDDRFMGLFMLFQLSNATVYCSSSINNYCSAIGFLYTAGACLLWV